MLTEHYSFRMLNNNYTQNGEINLFLLLSARLRAFFHTVYYDLAIRAAGFSRGLFLFPELKLLLNDNVHAICRQRHGTFFFRTRHQGSNNRFNGGYRRYMLYASNGIDRNGNKKALRLAKRGGSAIRPNRGRNVGLQLILEADRHSHSQNRLQCERFGISIRPNSLLNAMSWM